MALDALTIGAAVATFAVLGFALLPANDAKALNRRLKRVTAEGLPAPAEAEGEKVQLRRNRQDSGIPLLDAFIKNALPNPDKLRQRLARTGKKITISEYLLITGVCVFAGIALAKMLLGLSTGSSILLGVAGGLFLPHMVTGMMAKKRAKNFIKFFPESIDAMVRGIRSGLPISESIKTVGQEMPDPIGEEFRQITDLVRLGRSLDEAMWEVAKRLDVPEYRYLIIALSIQRETGGNLAETLANVSDVLRRRRQMKLKIKAMSSEAKASAMILGALPFFVATVLTVVSPEYMTVLFNDPRGHILLGIAVGMLGIGIFVMSQMINFDF